MNELLFIIEPYVYNIEEREIKCEYVYIFVKYGGGGRDILYSTEHNCD